MVFPHRIPVRTIFDSHAGGGICAIAISQDARCLVTISAGMVQVRIFPLCVSFFKVFLVGLSRSFLLSRWGIDWDFIKRNAAELREGLKLG